MRIVLYIGFVVMIVSASTQMTTTERSDTIELTRDEKSKQLSDVLLNGLEVMTFEDGDKVILKWNPEITQHAEIFLQTEDGKEINLKRVPILPTIIRTKRQLSGGRRGDNGGWVRYDKKENWGNWNVGASTNDVARLRDYSLNGGASVNVGRGTSLYGQGSVGFNGYREGTFGARQEGRRGNVYAETSFNNMGDRSVRAGGSLRTGRRGEIYGEGSVNNRGGSSFGLGYRIRF